MEEEATQDCIDAFLMFDEKNNPIQTNNGFQFITEDETIYHVKLSEMENVRNLDEHIVVVDNEIVKLHFCQRQSNDESQVIPSSNGTSWGDDNTKYLLHLYKNKKDKFPMKKQLWHEITRLLNETGCNFTNIQVENRFKTLERAYKKMTENNNATGRGRKNCSYEKELNDIFAKESNIFPEAVASTSSFLSRKDLLEKARIRDNEVEKSPQKNQKEN